MQLLSVIHVLTHHVECLQNYCILTDLAIATINYFQLEINFCAYVVYTCIVKTKDMCTLLLGYIQSTYMQI